MPPLERHPLLRPLSREHHAGLLLCWRIRQALRTPEKVDHLFVECQKVFHTELLPHFAVEEEVVFPVLGTANPLVQRAVAEHRDLAGLFGAASDPRSVLTRIAEELDMHIRFEERLLFPAVQAVATEAQLERIDRMHGVVMEMN